MSEDTVQPTTPAPTPPPHGDEKSAEKYLQKLLLLIDQNKVTVEHTDLKKYDLSTMQDHYLVDLTEYEVEVSHSKQPDTNKDFYVMLFNSIKKVQAECTHKVILAYIHLNEDQFRNFKSTAQGYIDRKHREEEEKHFQLAMEPIDHLLENLTSFGKVHISSDTSPDYPQNQEN